MPDIGRVATPCATRRRRPGLRRPGRPARRPRGTRALRWAGMSLACTAGLGGSVAAAPQGALTPAAGPTLTAVSQSFDVAVAPFVNLSQRPDDDWIGARIAEALATAFRVRGWTLTSCTTPAARGGFRGPGAAAGPATTAARQNMPSAWFRAPGHRSRARTSASAIAFTLWPRSSTWRQARSPIEAGSMAPRGISSRSGTGSCRRWPTALPGCTRQRRPPSQGRWRSSLPRARAEDRAPAGTGHTAAASAAPESRPFGASGTWPATRRPHDLGGAE